jgi:hypothetical protein
MGPLRGLIRELAASRKFNGPTASAVKGLSQAIWENIDLVIEKLNHAKHDKHDKGELAQDRNVNSAICQLGNVLQKILSGKYIGYFEDVRKQGFASNKYNGTFRIADNAAPYYQYLDYNGCFGFSNEPVYLVDPQQGTALCLSPLLVWVPGSSHRGESPQCYAFDSSLSRSAYSFKSLCSSNAKTFTEAESTDLVGVVAHMAEEGFAFEFAEGLRFSGDESE